MSATLEAKEAGKTGEIGELRTRNELRNGGERASRDRTGSRTLNMFSRQVRRDDAAGGAIGAGEWCYVVDTEGGMLLSRVGLKMAR